MQIKTNPLKMSLKGKADHLGEGQTPGPPALSDNKGEKGGK